MKKLTNNQRKGQPNRWPKLQNPEAMHTKFLLLVGLAAMMALSGCGSNNNSSVQPPVQLIGSSNWQFTMAPPTDGSFVGGLQGGFLVQGSSSAVTGSLVYSVSLPSNPPVVCNTGSAAITGTISNQAVSLTATAGTQTFTLVGTLDIDGTTMSGTYTSTAGTAADGSPCGNAEAGLDWSAVLVPSISGTVQGTFYSGGGSAGLDEQDFLVSGWLLQGTNTGSSSASITGSLNFLPDYPCFSAAVVSGQISGNTVSLQLLGSNGSVLGQIGVPLGSTTGLSLVTLNPVNGGYILSGQAPSYIVATGTPPATAANPCPGDLNASSTAGDFGTVCLAGNSASGCTQPITLAPSALAFSSQRVGTTSTQTITLTDSSKSELGLTLQLSNNSGVFSETDQCGPAGVPSNGAPFYLLSGQSCLIKISYTPACSGSCPSSQAATLDISDPGQNTIFTLPLAGTPQADSEDVHVSETSAPKPSTLGDKDEYPLSAFRSTRGQDPEDHAEDH
jgi:hypothetical protein